MTHASDTRTIGVLLPTRDCAVLARDHVASLQAWAGLAEEWTVVDSDSKDDTVEVIRQGLAHPRIRFLNHPPGLYQSWNFGIQNTASKYLYISTVGDSISRHGIEHLYEVAEKFQSDVVISKPEFINEAGAPLPDDQWLIDVLLDRLKIREPRLLSTREQFLFAVTNLWGAIIGSSASNLYRTDCLKQRPFPTEYGTAGDGAWGIQNIFDIKIAVTPERFSTFRRHAKTYSLVSYQVESLALKFFRLVQSTIARQRAGNPAISEILDAVRWAELEPALDASGIAQDKLTRLRHHKTPWFLQSAGWQARMIRSRARRKIDAITRQVLAANY